MKILIQKFGGTSVSTKERRMAVAEKIIKAKKEGYSPVVVVSAMGRIGQSYATDSLLMLLSEEYKKHNKQGVDLLMGCGEIISSVVMSNDLYAKGIAAVPLTGGQAGIITDGEFGDAQLKTVDTNQIMKLLNDNIVPVVTGFQGITEEGFLTTLGRGGSDVSASILGVALKAEEIHIYTDVDGIMTADPRIVEDATLIKGMSYNEVFQFAYQGAKVIHPRAVEIAMKGNIPLVIKNTMSECPGTVIDNLGDIDSNMLITGITHMSNRIQVTVELAKNMNNDNFYDLLNVLGERSVSIDLINVFPNQKIFTIDNTDLQKLDKIMVELNLYYSYIDNCSKISVIGSKMCGIPGVMARILKALTKENIEVLQTADSHTTIWCLVGDEYTQPAIKALHKEFNLENK